MAKDFHVHIHAGANGYNVHHFGGGDPGSKELGTAQSGNSGSSHHKSGEEAALRATQLLKEHQGVADGGPSDLGVPSTAGEDASYAAHPMKGAFGRGK